MNDLLKTVLAEANERARLLKEARSGEAHFVPKGNGSFGMMLVLDDANPMIPLLAKALGVPDDWKITSIEGGLYAAYNSGDRLSIAQKEADLKGDDEDEDDE